MLNKKYELGKQMFLEGKSITTISKELGISAAWFGRYLREQGIDTRHNATKINFNRKFFKTIDSEEKAYWLGFIAADGCINEQYKNNRLKAMTMELTVNEQDKEHLQKFCTAIGLDEKQIKKKNVILNGAVFPAYKVTLCSTDMCRDLIKLGVTPRKSFSIHMPPIALNSPYLRHYVRGFFDGNGHISEDSRRITFSSGSAKMLVQLNSLFYSLGCEDVKITTDFPRSRGLELRYHGNQGFDIIIDYMYKDATIYLTRKYNQYIAHLHSNV